MYSFMRHNVGEYIIFGDFNVVRTVYERSGMNFCAQTTDDFKNFIFDMDLLDVHMGEDVLHGLTNNA